MNGTPNCAVVTCEAPSEHRGMCSKHYQRQLAARTPSSRMALANFDDGLDHDGPIMPHRPDLGQCWEWKRSKNELGYGLWPRVAFGTRLAHRIALTLKLGREVNGVAMHECDNPPCCRPSHLKEGTHAENAADCSAKKRRPHSLANKTHCKNGHAVTEDTLRTRSNGSHHCALCTEATRLRGLEAKKQQRRDRREKEASK